MADKTILGVTSAGKEIELVRIHNRSLSKVQFTSGGQLPAMLDMAFGDRRAAQDAVSRYLELEAEGLTANSRRKAK